MNSLATSAPAVKQFGENFYSSRKSIQNLESIVAASCAETGRSVITNNREGTYDSFGEMDAVAIPGLDSIVLSSNNTRRNLLLLNKYKLNRQLKDALCVNGVVQKKVVRNCLKSSIMKEAEIEIHLPKKGAAIIKNTMTCKNFWQCPVCRTNMLKQKRKNIQLVVNKSKTQNLMMTQTLRHSRDDSLAMLVDVLLKLPIKVCR